VSENQTIQPRSKAPKKERFKKLRDAFSPERLSLMWGRVAAPDELEARAWPAPRTTGRIIFSD